ncbi:unnamed protein product [Rhizoctonia solani]|uniref:Uncharacterized protein n=3 Tax=Rhizoctonia solani TaxID=456999 RepID=A0A8H3A000_9AGAM|nr:hypothetical protein RSOL_125850 [Rhizoctonia solani AG-3 Rhs1AP]KEP54169.1 hypothetical protein V565_021130 [Rhizoctonia solani 123E]CAE6364677.1 unnamed protein product [Rhizoctonia solani]CAE6382771.1 unnamed protein product [Rhizoctonia solani]
MVHPALDDCHWQKRTDANGAVTYTRPMVAGERTLDQVHQLVNGHDQFAFGATFQTNLSSGTIEKRLLDALVQLRYYSPIIAAQPQAGIHDHELRSWVYAPLPDSEAAAAWARQSLILRSSEKEMLDPEKHLRDIVSKPLPPNEIFKLYLVGPYEDGQFTLMTYKSHALAEGQAAIDLLATLLDWVINPIVGVELMWGREWQNLLPGTVVVLGGEKKGWDEESPAILEENARNFTFEKPAHALRPQRRSITNLGHIVRIHRQLEEAATLRLIKAAKSEGVSITQLFEAANAIATYTIELLPAEELAESHIRYFPSIVSTRHLLQPPYNKREMVGNLNTAFTQIIPGKLHFDKPTLRERVLAVAHAIKENYRAFMSNPHHPLILAAECKLYPLRGPLGVDINECTGEILGLGVLDNKLPLSWRSSDNQDTIRISDVHIGLRQCNKRPMVHVWTLEGKLRLQIQASDVWDEAYLERFLDEVIKSALSIC